LTPEKNDAAESVTKLSDISDRPRNAKCVEIVSAAGQMYEKSH